MFETLKSAFTTKEVRTKILMTLFMLLVYRIGSYIPIPGLDVAFIQQNFTDENSFFQLMNAVNGQALANGTIFALGILPFINAFIIMQLITLIVPKLDAMSKEGEEGRRKLTQITRYVAIGLGIVQAIGIVVSWSNSGAVNPLFLGLEAEGAVNTAMFFSQMFIVIMLVGGSTFVMWIGERITEYGIGNGTSLIIFVGILSSITSALLNGFSTLPAADDATAVIIQIIGFIIIVCLVFFFIVYVDLAVRKVNVQYAKQVKGNKMYGGQSTHIPIKINASGVMPIIFASSFMMFPQMVISLFWPGSDAEVWFTQNMGMNAPWYPIIMAGLILFFAYFYAQIQFDPEDVARNIQQYGGFIPGIRPGKPTVDHLKKINNRITFFGAIFLSIVMLVPTIIFQTLFSGIGMSNAFSATGLLIVVSVALEFNKQLEAQLMMRHYKGFLK
ncbi:MAG: preprotein translocase subunit SecY [Clostridiales bacterium]|jgi:preprotein translocase subunit SecY|nr:preprotein translocase subunit SecY [Clostridiales bacterium]